MRDYTDIKAEIEEIESRIFNLRELINSSYNSHYMKDNSDVLLGVNACVSEACTSLDRLDTLCDYLSDKFEEKIKEEVE